MPTRRLRNSPSAATRATSSGNNIVDLLQRFAPAPEYIEQEQEDVEDVQEDAGGDQDRVVVLVRRSRLKSTIVNAPKIPSPPPHR